MTTTTYVNLTTQEHDQGDRIPADRPRHTTYYAAQVAQIDEGWPVQGAAIVVEVDDAGYGMGVVHS